MTPLHCVLAATDLSAPSRHAVARAALIARDCGARLELLHVLETGMLDQLRRLLGQGADAALPQMQEDVRNALSLIARDFCEPLGISPGIHIASGDVLEKIADQADAKQADLLVMGARGLGFMHHLLLGSTAERMLRKTLRSLLIVKQLPHESYQRVLIPVDFSEYALRSIRLARVIAPQADIILLHAFDTSMAGTLRYAGVDEGMIHEFQLEGRQEALRNLQRLAQDAGLDQDRHQRIALSGYPPACILEQEEEKDADLIIIGKHGRGVGEELLLGSVTKHVLAESRGDVLVAR